jgi:stress-induced morphogen
VIIETSIRQKLTSELAPEHLDVVNESRMHSVPPGSETHFKVLVVSPAFEGLGSLERHRRIHGILAAELKGGVHALTLRALTPAQWAAEGGANFESPKCLGGSKASPSEPNAS